MCTLNDKAFRGRTYDTGCCGRVYVAGYRVGPGEVFCSFTRVLWLRMSGEGLWLMFSLFGLKTRLLERLQLRLAGGLAGGELSLRL